MTKGYCIIQLGTGCAVSYPAGADHSPVEGPGCKVPEISRNFVFYSTYIRPKSTLVSSVLCTRSQENSPSSEQYEKRQILFTEEKVQKISILFLHF